MDDVDLILLRLEKEPDDLTTVAALTDALMELRDMTRTEADRHAENAVQTARDARDLSAAADLLKKEQPWHDELSSDILDACGLTAVDVASVVLVPGDTAPLHAEQRRYAGSGWWTDHSVTVGAQWVIKHWRSNPSLCLMGPPKRKRRPRPR